MLTCGDLNSKPAVSVIVCTHNQLRVQFEWTLAALELQSLSPERFEVIVVDNHSSEPLEEGSLRGRGKVNFRLVHEPKLGHSNARCAGIRAAQADLFVFVDDDNYLF